MSGPERCGGKLGEPRVVGLGFTTCERIACPGCPDCRPCERCGCERTCPRCNGNPGDNRCALCDNTNLCPACHGAGLRVSV